MKLTVLLPMVVGLLVPSVASAHLVSSGLGPFYDGALHLLISPAALLGVLVVALLAGLQERQTGRWAVWATPGAWLVLGLIGLNTGGAVDLGWVGAASLVIVGALVAADTRLGSGIMVGLASLFGAINGYANGTALAGLESGLAALLGIVATVFVLNLLTIATAASVRWAWSRIAVRTAGSWVATIGLLMIGWLSQALS